MGKIIIKKDKFFSVKQTGGTFYVCKMTPKILKSITQKDISRYKNFEEDIQRELSSSREREIKEYIYENEFAVFPNTFIISLSSKSKINEEGDLIINDSPDEAYILDGQHRLSGFDKNDEDFEIVVSVFIGLELFKKALIFADINSNQVKVNKSLAYSLYSIFNPKKAENDQLPQYYVFQIINKLNQDSVWENKINILGKGSGDISLAPIYEELLKECTKETGIFKIYFDENSYENIYFILSFYYSALHSKYPKEWKNYDKNYILTKTTGFYAFFRFLKFLYGEFKISNTGFSEETFNKIFEKIELKQLTSENYESGIKGQNRLFNDLRFTYQSNN